MKRLLQSSFLVLSLLIFSHTTSFAQEQQGPTKIGVGILYGDEPESAGIDVDATFRLTPEFAFAPGVNIYFPDDHDTIYDSYWDVNLNGQYIFAADMDYHAYLLGGLNITNANYDERIGEDNDTKLGINLGVGGEYHLEHFSLFGELKYVVGDFDQVVLGVGARFPLH